MHGTDTEMSTRTYSASSSSGLPADGSIRSCSRITAPARAQLAVEAADLGVEQGQQCAAVLADPIRRVGQGQALQFALTTIPGIGPFIAIVLVLELGDIARFPSAKQVASYVGLTPRIRASAGRIRAGHISKEGNRLLRWVLVLAATQAVRRPGPLRTWFHAVKKRRGKKVARVALARRLAEIVFHVWKHECDYFAVVRHGVVRG